MNRKGFTLIEMLAVIALLGVLSMIVVPVIDNALKSGREKLNATQKAQIIKGAKEFFADNLYCLPGSDNTKCTFESPEVDVISDGVVTVTLECLKKAGYLPDEIVNIEKEESYNNNNTKVQVTKSNDNFTYTVIEGE